MTLKSNPAPWPQTSARLWYLDSSVALRILLGHSAEAIHWYDARVSGGDDFVSSSILVLEMTRVLRRESLNPDIVDEFVSQLTLLKVDDALIAEASAIRPHIKSLDALHLASAQRLGVASAAIATHDLNMNRVAQLLGFEVTDPVV